MIQSPYGTAHLQDVFGDDTFNLCGNDASMDGRIIQLPVSEVMRPTLIIECASGYWYTAQTHGVACHHPIVEGVAVPLDWPHDAIPHGDYCEGIDDAVAAAIDGLARGAFVVDRERPGNWAEAWYPVRLPDGRTGVLTYENCD